MSKKTYVGEMEWSIDNALALMHDRNEHRYAQVAGALRYGLKVGIARRSREPIPARPDLESMI